MPSLAACRCPFRLMRHCFLGKWICLLVSEGFRLVWRCHLFDYSTYILFCVHWHGGLCLRLLVPNDAVVFWLGWVYLSEFSSLISLISEEEMEVSTGLCVLCLDWLFQNIWLLTYLSWSVCLWCFVFKKYLTQNSSVGYQYYKQYLCLNNLSYLKPFLHC